MSMWSESTLFARFTAAKHARLPSPCHTHTHPPATHAAARRAGRTARAGAKGRVTSLLLNRRDKAMAGAIDHAMQRGLPLDTVMAAAGVSEAGRAAGSLASARRWWRGAHRGPAAREPLAGCVVRCARETMAARPPPPFPAPLHTRTHTGGAAAGRAEQERAGRAAAAGAGPAEPACRARGGLEPAAQVPAPQP
jgi:hypothetical protein